MSLQRFCFIFLVISGLIFSLGQPSLKSSVLAGSILGDILTPNYTWHDDGDQDGVRFGHSVAGAADYNADGYADAVVGSPNFKVGSIVPGMAFVYAGSPNGLSEHPQHMLSPMVHGANFGISVSSAGDVNDDGFDDLIVGADNYKQDGVVGAFGAAMVYHGSKDGLNEEPDWIVYGPHKDSLFGHTVCGAGDVNKDGYDDVLVGAKFFTGGQDLEGAVYLYLGSKDGLLTTPVWQFESDKANAQFGYALAGTGDLNKDGFADVVIGAPLFDVDISLRKAGRVYVFFGSGSGLSASPDWSMTGSQPEEWFGSAVAGAGNVDGDGYLDLIIGARGYHEAQADIDVTYGAAYLFNNSSSGFESKAAWMIKMTEAYTGFGSSVAGLGDVNNDGYADAAVGAPFYTDDQPQEGAVFVYPGSPDGLLTHPGWVAYGNKAETEFGFSIAAGGDLNGDFRKDLLIGAPIFKYDEKTKMGRAFSYHGMAAGDIIYHYSFLPLLLGP